MQRLQQFMYEACSGFRAAAKPRLRFKTLDDVPPAFAAMLRPGQYVSPGVVRRQAIKRLHEATAVFDGTEIHLICGQVGQRRPPMMRLMQMLMLFVFVLNRLNRQERVDVMVVPFDKPKQMPAEFTPLSPEHVNSGLNVRYSQGPSYILVYRSEEMIKVLLHEVMHHYQMDWYDPGHDELMLQHIQSYVPLASPRLGLNEVYNDTMCVLFLSAIKVFRSARKMTLPAFRALHSRAVAAARAHARKQACGILRYYSKGSLHDAGALSEKSHVFSYYFGKAIVLSDLAAFLEVVPPNYLMRNDPANYNRFSAFFLDCMIQNKHAVSCSPSTRSATLRMTPHTLDM